jgi:NADPH:quinone reductase
MRALVCRDFGTADQLHMEDWPQPVIAANQVRIAVQAAALNFPDVLAIAGKYQIKAPLPFVPGGEAAGVVTEVGQGVGQFAVGDRVIYSGSYGAFVEQACVPATSLLAMPTDMDFPTAASFNVTYSTSYHALKQRAALRPGETLLVLGAAGGVGLAAVNIGAAMGARVIAAASTEAKLDVACAAGAVERINYSTEALKERIKALTRGVGVDVVYDAIGGEYSEPALRSVAWDGRFLVVGFAAGNIASIPLNLPLLKGCAILGVFLGAWRERDPGGYRRNFSELCALYSSGRVRPLISRTFSLDQYRDAFAELSGRRAVGKVVFNVSAPLNR